MNINNSQLFINFNDENDRENKRNISIPGDNKRKADENDGRTTDTIRKKARNNNNEPEVVWFSSGSVQKLQKNKISFPGDNKRKADEDLGVSDGRITDTIRKKARNNNNEPEVVWFSSGSVQNLQKNKKLTAENERLREENKRLREENEEYKKTFEDTYCFIEGIKKIQNEVDPKS